MKKILIVIVWGVGLLKGPDRASLKAAAYSHLGQERAGNARRLKAGVLVFPTRDEDCPQSWQTHPLDGTDA